MTQKQRRKLVTSFKEPVHMVKTKKLTVRCISSMQMIQALKTSLMITSNVSKANVASSLPDKIASGPNNDSNVPLAVTIKEAGNGKTAKIEKKVASDKKSTKSKTANSVPKDLQSVKTSLDSSSQVIKEVHDGKMSLNQKDPSTTAANSPDFKVALLKEIKFFEEKFRTRMDNILKAKESQILKLRQMNTNLEKKNSKIVEDLEMRNHHSKELLEMERNKLKVSEINMEKLKSLVKPLKYNLEEQQMLINDLKIESNEVKEELEKINAMNEELTKAKESLMKDLDALHKDHSDKKDSYKQNLVRLSKAAIDAKASIELKSKENAELKAEVDKLRASKDKESNSRVGSLRQEIETLKGNLSELQKDLEESKSKFNLSTKTNESLKKVVESAKVDSKALEDLKTKQEKTSEELLKVSKMLKASSLENLKKDIEIKEMKKILGEEKKKLNEPTATSPKRKTMASPTDTTSGKKSKASTLGLKDCKKSIAQRGNELIQNDVNPQGQSFKNHGEALKAQQLNSFKKQKQGNENVYPETSRNEGTDDGQNDYPLSSGLSLLTNIDLFTSSLASARKELSCN